MPDFEKMVLGGQMESFIAAHKLLEIYKNNSGEKDFPRQ